MKKINVPILLFILTSFGSLYFFYTKDFLIGFILLFYGIGSLLFHIFREIK